MDSVALYIGIAIAIVLVAVVVLVALVRGRSKASAPPVTAAPPEADSTTVEVPPGRGVDPDVSDAVADDSSIAVLDRPEAPAGRLTRLRSRLARSNKLGQGLLALLSRGDLTEDTWDEIEETLLTSDLGVGPTTELMEQLRTEIKVQGNSDPAKVREFLRQDLLGL
ncbi:MAG: signal recognition particle receptor subunit alpha, partial [Candidatus Nanopelagicales bacterium]